MRSYSANGPNTSGTTATLVGITNTSAVRSAIFEFTIGCGATPADQAMVVHLGRYTVAGTSTAYTPVANDSSDVAAIAVGGITHTVEPTYTANQSVFASPLNQRATFRWVASPGMEFKGPATAANGHGLKIVGATAAMVCTGTVQWFE